MSAGTSAGLGLLIFKHGTHHTGGVYPGLLPDKRWAGPWGRLMPSGPGRPWIPGGGPWGLYGFRPRWGLFARMVCMDQPTLMVRWGLAGSPVMALLFSEPNSSRVCKVRIPVPALPLPQLPGVHSPAAFWPLQGKAEVGCRILSAPQEGRVWGSRASSCLLCFASPQRKA